MPDEDEQRRYDELVARCYECVLDNAAWRELLRQLVAAGGYQQGALLFWDSAGYRSQVSTISHHCDPAAIELYNRHYCALDPAPQLLLPRGVGDWYHDGEVLGAERIRRDPYYQEFHLPSGLRNVSCVKLSDQPDSGIYLSLLTMAGAPPPSAGQRTLLQRLTPHLLVAARLAQRMDDMALELAKRNLLLDQYPTPVWLLDGDSRQLYANPAAERLMGLAHAPLQQHSGRLYGRTGNTRLQAMIRQAAGRDGLLRAGWLQLVEQQGLLVSPVRAEYPGNTLFQRPLVLLTLLENRASPQPLAELFNLTPAEQRLAELLCEGLLPKECATRLAVSINTVRSQLRALFRKTGTERQTELVQLLTRLQQR